MGLRKWIYDTRVRIFGPTRPLVTTLRLEGVIASHSRVQKALTFDSLVDDIEKAFAPAGLSAVALIINSPGGSVVQSALITDRIRQLAQEKHVPVLAFTEDVAASGGYMLALAADEIIAHEASLIGSIGVIAAGFGFSEVLHKIGVERRVHTAGERKSMLDPFKPETQEDKERLDEMLAGFHDYFKAFVRDRRGKRLKGLRGRIFSGEVFTGIEALKLGLVDETDQPLPFLKRRFGDNVRIRPVRRQRRTLSSLFSFGRSQGHSQGIPVGIMAAVEERLWWNKFGL